MDDLKETALCALIWAVFGACAMAGAKVADWLIPSPPQQPVRIEVKDPSGVVVPRTGIQKGPYIIG
jgi:hypothetical protein